MSDFLPSQEILDGMQSASTVKRVSANYAATYKDNVILVDTSAGDVTVLLPRALNGKEFNVVKNSAAHTLGVTFTGTDNCFGSSIVTLTALGEAKRFKSIPGGFITL